MVDQAGSVEVEVRAALEPFRRGMAQAERETRAFDQRSQRAFGGTQRAVAAMTAGMNRARAAVFSLQGAMVGLGAGLFLRRAITTIREFETQMAGVGAVTSATRDQMEAMTRQARELGARTVFSASQAAGGMEFLGRAGFDTQQIMAALPGTLDLAAAGALELSRSADIASNVLQTFNMQATEMGRVGDVLSAAAASANTNVDQLAQGLSMAGPVAESFRISLEDTVAAIGTLSNAGIQATRAGTGLRRVITGLASPTDQLRAFMGGLSLEADGFNAVMEQLAGSTMTSAEAMEIFGDRGGPAFLVLRQGVRGTRELSGALREAEGEARRLAEERLGPMERAMRELNSATEELMLSMGEGGLADAVAHVSRNLTEFARSGDAAAMAERLGSAMKTLADNTDIVAASVGAFIGLRIGASIHPLVGILGAVAGGWLAYSQATTGATDAVETHQRALDILRGSLRDVDTGNKESAASAHTAARANLEAGRAALQRARAELQLAQAITQAEMSAFVVGMPQEGIDADPRVARARQTVTELERLNREAERELGSLEDRMQFTPIFGAGVPGGGATEATTSPRGAGGAGGAAQAELDAFQRTIRMIHDRTDAILLEQQVIGQSIGVQEAARAEMELMNAAREAGIALGPDEVAMIQEAARGYGEAAQRLDELQEAAFRAEQAQRQLLSAAQNFATGFVRDMRNGVSATDALGSALGRLADRLIDMALNNMVENALGPLLGGSGGGGGFGAALASVFSGGGSALPNPTMGALFANGTANTGGSRNQIRGLVHGQEAVIPLPNSGKVPVEVRGAGGKTEVHIHNAPPGTQVEEREDARGGRRVDVMLDEMVTSSTSREGSVWRRMMQADFNAKPRLIQR